ncbi:MAG: hypothetical protein M1826_001488 [Phylliscum demangeonii]|nr:MAG: hypothetical protein M1826_001488 [Phylliscum demangeonii]
MRGPDTTMVDADQESKSQGPPSNQTPPAAMDDEVKRLYDAAQAGGNDFHQQLLEFLAHDVPQATASSISSTTARKRMQQVMAEDLALARHEIDHFNKIRAQYPSQNVLHKMTAVELDSMLTTLKANYINQVQTRIRAEEKMDEAEAKAKRERTNLEKMKREHGEKEARRKKRKLTATSAADEDEDEDHPMPDAI